MPTVPTAKVGECVACPGGFQLELGRTYVTVLPSTDMGKINVTTGSENSSVGTDRC